ncbi:peptidoglycan bridge formation protein FemAB, partial [Escherichia coli]
MSHPLRIARLPAHDLAVSARWDDFVLACPQATFFHRSGWQRVIASVFGHRCYFLYAERDGVIEGVLPLAEIKSRLFGHSLTSLPFAVYG